MHTPQTERVHFIDGVRGWGAVFVLLYHLWVEGFPVSKEIAIFLKGIFLFNGPLAVYIFFIASGFSLSISYFNNNNPVVLKKILVGRYFRLIIPIGVASLICYIALIFGLIIPPALRPGPFANFILEIPTFREFAQFHFFEVLYNFSYSKSLILPLWTMQFEFIGSILLILSLLLVHGRKHKAFLLMPLIIASTLFNFLYLIFFIGAIFAWLYTKYKIQNTKYTLIWTFLFALSAISSWFFYDFGKFFQLACAVGFFASAMYWNKLRIFLSSRLSIYLGKISFPLYLIHGVVMWVVGLNLIGLLNTWIINFLCIFISLLTAHFLISVDSLGTVVSRKIGSLIFDKYSSIHAK